MTEHLANVLEQDEHVKRVGRRRYKSEMSIESRSVCIFCVGGKRSQSCNFRRALRSANSIARQAGANPLALPIAVHS